MKKFAICFIACVAMIQSTFAATSPLTESLLEIEAITNAIGTDPNFQNVIPTSEFITEINRITKQINVLGEVMYEILTVVPMEDTDCSESSSRHHKKHSRPVRYIAVVNVAANPGIGPNIVTVVSIVKTRHKK
jgi:hypothetical protein